VFGSICLFCCWCSAASAGKADNLVMLEMAAVEVAAWLGIGDGWLVVEVVNVAGHGEE